ncbi:MAG: hypothetical protein M1839_005424 [Geoglossum umbratile]|nr:MAG: hypothetical protein M1839_005424 [Geoglossum umbratile]
MSKQARKPRVRKDGVKLDLPGDPQAPNTFIDCSSDAEGKLAWYLGYQDLAKFRQFICSFWFLEQWLQCDGWKHGLSHKKAFHLIRERDHAKYFSEDIDLTTNYPIKAIGPDHQRYESEDDICRNYRYAHILISIVRIINAGDILGDDNNKRLERQKAVETQFRHLNSLDLPAIELTDLQFPTLGPFLELGESELEPHNRALMMIRYMNKQATTKLWPKRFWSKTAFTSMLLQPDHGPHWMSRGHQPVTSKAPLIPVIVSGLLPKVFTIKWTRKAKFPGFDDLMAWIDDEGPVLPTDKQPAEKDPRKYNGKQWRDSVRRQYQCRELGL